MGVKFELRTPPGQKPDGSPLDPIEYVEIPVSPSEVVSHAATDADREKYSSQYRAFKKQQEEAAPEPTEGAVVEAQAASEPAKEPTAENGAAPEGQEPEREALPAEEAPRDEAPR